ncbi:MAG: phytochrome sensor protein [Desulfatitalea sp. BRH_c12]|nr:MAG: phytochrome sensor protein [Desulfatitalea sp. BRH_c12]
MNQEAPPARRFDLKAFKAISRAISTYGDLKSLFGHFVEGIARSFKIKGASIMLYDEREGQLFRVGSYGISKSYLQKGPVFMSEQEEIFTRGVPVFIQNLQGDPRVQYPQAAESENIRAMLSFPIKSRNSVIGILRLYHDQPIDLHPEDVDSIAVLALHVGLAIEENGLRNFVQMVDGAMANLPPRMRKGS